MPLPPFEKGRLGGISAENNPLKVAKFAENNPLKVASPDFRVYAVPMKRSIEEDLLTWKNRQTHVPLLVRGARQVGKSFVVEQFGREHFASCITANFEQKPFLNNCFEALEPQKIINSLEIALNTTITPGQTLLFLDEIQECPQAILALRYFKEQMPALHVIGAGSLLEFALNDEDFRMPVGRLQFLYLRPFSFLEFLEALGFHKLREHVEKIDLQHPVDPNADEQLMQLLREYLALGGMPAVVHEYLETKKLNFCQEIQTSLLATYRNDFGKYAKKVDHKNLQRLFERAPGLIAQWFKYSKVDPDVQPRDMRVALDKLEDAGLLRRIHATSASGIPLITNINPKKFKLLFLDVGLVKRAYQLDLSQIFEQDIMLLNRGMLAEQFVGQELLAYGDRHEAGDLFFWVREQAGSSAEVDYVITVNDQIIPLEVKSGAVGKLKSLKLFMQEKPSKLGIRVSQAPLAYSHNILSVPFYLISQIPRLVKSL